MGGFSLELNEDQTDLRDWVHGFAKDVIRPAASEWDERVCSLMVTDTTERTMKVRVLVSAASSGQAFDLGCKVREALLAFVAREYPECLPRTRWVDPQTSQA